MLLKLFKRFHLLVDMSLDLLATTPTFQLPSPYSLDVLGKVILNIAGEVTEEVQKRLVSCTIHSFEGLLQLIGIIFGKPLIDKLNLFVA